MMKGSIAVAALVQLAAASSSVEEAPNNAVSKVVDMLRDMKEKIEADDKADEAAFNKYMCWCDKVQESKTMLIKEAKEAISHLTAEIKENEGEKEAQVATLEDIDVKQEATEEKKEEENEEYDAVHAAFLLKEAQQTQILQALVKSTGLLGESPMFLQKDSSKPRQLSLLQESSSTGSKYAPQSLSVSGILEDMQKNFGINLAEETSTENKNTDTHVDLNEDFDGTLHTLHKSEVKTEADKAETETVIADDTELKDDTTEQRDADTEFLSQAEQSCVDRREEYNARMELRLQELDGVTKALDNLMDEKNRALFFKSVKSFVQVETSSTSAVRKAYSELRSAASQKRSYRLASVASQVHKQLELPNGGFTAVLGSIGDMIKQLKEEGESDAKKKDYCKKEYQEINKEKAKREFLIKKNDATITQIDSRVEELLHEKALSEAAIKSAEEELAQAKAIREEENSVYKTEKADDEAAISVLTDTRAMLAKFYEENTGGDGTSLAVSKFDPNKLSNKRRDLMREEEKYELTDKASNKGAATMILSMIDRIISNSEDEIKDSTGAEEKAQADFDKQEQETNSLVDDLDKKITSINSQVNTHKENKADENGQMGENQEELDGQKAYEEELKPECDWIIAKFDERYDKREAEMDSLQHAKELLSGSVY
eukprot:TRINITY_DN1966_c0_g1_i2.p1 TRINITY_DN1966_c0_g1~~TRINITY_DN1966_c0_g1_i2.p1  ORF type:complete len:660 (-),score=239.60 TRINITY_DN1966_c0_g1_i2:121-2100(-)